MSRRERHYVGKIFQVLSLHPSRVGALIILALFLAFSEAMSVGLLLPIAEILTSANMDDSVLPSWILARVTWSTESLQLFILLVFAGAIFVKTVVSLSNVYLLSVFSEVLRRDLSERYMNDYYFSDLSKISKSAALNATLTEAAQVAKLSRDVIDLFVSALVTVSIVIIMVYISPTVVFGVVSFVLIAHLADRLYLRKLSISLGNRRVEINQLIASRLRELIEAIVEVRTLKLFEFSKTYISGAFKGYGRTIGLISIMRVITAKIVELIIGLSFVVLALVVIYNGRTGFSIGELGVIFLGMLRIGTHASNAYGLILSISNKLPSLNQFVEVINRDLRDGAPSKPAVEKPSYLKISEVGGSLGEGVSVALREYCIERGKLNLIVGKSGTGKSTLCHILAGLRGAESFSVVFADGVTLDQKDFLNRVNTVFVPQEQNFFDLSVEDNIRLPERSGNVNVDVVLSRLGLNEWMNKHRHSIVGDGGLNPSVGQMRRLAIARALLSDPDLLIIDEPTAGLDSNSEKDVTTFIEELSSFMLVLVVTHSELLMSRSHNIYTLDG